MRLEWEIESRKISRRGGEDPQARRARRRGLLRLLMIIGIFIGLIIGGLLLARQRLLDAQNQIEQLLRDTVRAEVAALRVGDWAVFINIQRSASDDWLDAQRAAYQQYADMKASRDLKLTGRILATAIDGPRGRVLVEEVVDGTPYAKVWFYWRYDDGWRHVPPDYTFWGEERRIESAVLRIEYRAVDELFARQAEAAVTGWLRQGCDILGCGGLPQMTIKILTDLPQAAAWADDGRLLLQSPYAHGARADRPFDAARQLDAAKLLADRLIQAQTGDLTFSYPHDVVQLRQSAHLYLVEQFAQVDSGATLIESLASHYGRGKVGQLVSLFAPAADMSIIQQVIPEPIGRAKLDWRDFIAWRLDTEARLIASRAESEWLNLYDAARESTLAVAYERYRANQPPQPQRVVEQQVGTAADGTPQLRVTVRTGSDKAARDHTVLFNLVNSVWKRAS